MKTFTARDFNEKRQQIREAIKEGGCIIEYKLASREPDFKAVILPIEAYDEMLLIANAFPMAYAEEMESELLSFNARRLLSDNSSKGMIAPASRANDIIEK